MGLCCRKGTLSNSTMEKQSRILILLITILILFPAATATDVMFRGDPQHTGFFKNGGSVSNGELWRIPTGMENDGEIGGSPAIANGTVYFGINDWFNEGNNNLRAVDAKTGTEKWKFHTGGSRQSPTVVNGTVYAMGAGRMYALDAITGVKRWQFPETGFGSGTSPTVANGTVYYGGGSENTLHAINAVSGKEKWRFTANGWIESSPAVANDTVYFGCYDGNLYAVDALTGLERWRFPIDGYVMFSEWTPAVSNGIVYIGSNSREWNELNTLHAVDAVTGVERWKFQTKGPLATAPAVAYDMVYIGTFHGKLYALDAVTGHEKWQYRTNFIVQSSPAVANGVVFIGGGDDYLYAIDAATGKESWHFPVQGWQSSPTIDGGVIYLGNKDHYLYAIGNNTQTGIQHPTIPPPTRANSSTILPAIAALGVFFIIRCRQDSVTFSHTTPHEDPAFIQADSTDEKECQ